MKTKLIIAATFFLVTFATSMYAQDWPQFLGPERNNNSPQKNLLRSWPASGPEVLWTANIGIGYGGPVVKNGKVYLLDRIDSIGDIMRSFELTTAKNSGIIHLHLREHFHFRVREVYQRWMELLFMHVVLWVI